MGLIWAFLVYFLCGIGRDFLGTRWNISVYRGQRLSASLTGGLLTLLDMTILYMVITSNHPLLAIAYAGGCAAGIFMAMTKKG